MNAGEDVKTLVANIKKTVKYLRKEDYRSCQVDRTSPQIATDGKDCQNQINHGNYLTKLEVVSQDNFIYY